MSKKMVGVLGAAAVVILAAGPALADESLARAQESRAAIKEFGEALRGKLVSALESGGPVNAIDVCHSTAAQIAADISQKKGWKVARTSLKARNPKNAPDAWEKQVLVKFEKRKAAGEDPATMEDYAVLSDKKGGKVFRYMKAIPTAEKPCKTCHGGKLAADVDAAIKKHYPKDKARGYESGDIRGAFTVTQPVKMQ
ncbi:MAG: DUF3365 domain-containing protein [Magnetospirillum sp. WYHS-4]